MSISPERLRELVAEGGDAVRNEIERLRGETPGGMTVTDETTAQPSTSPIPDEADVTLTVGQSDLLTLHPQDADGNPVDAAALGTAVQWSEDSGGAVVALTASGDGLSCTVVSVAAGTAHVTATLGDVADTATFTVQDAAPAPPPAPPAPTVADLGLEAGAPYDTGGAAPAAGATVNEAGQEVVPFPGPGGPNTPPPGTAIGQASTEPQPAEGEGQPS